VRKGIDGQISFRIDDADHDRAKEFFRKKVDHEEHKGEEQPIDLDIEYWYKKRTLKQNNLYWALIGRLATARTESPYVVHAGVKEEHYPRLYYKELWVIKDTKLLTTVEESDVIEKVVVECAENKPPVDVYDIQCLWYEWRGEQKQDPLDGTYESEDAYREKHPYCEACGAGCEGLHLAHIASKGAGGSDELWNRFILCHKCHKKQHDNGWDSLVVTYKHIKWKRDNALKRAGEDVDQPDEQVDKKEELMLF